MARHRLLEMQRASRIPIFETWIEYLMAWLDRRGAYMLDRLSGFGSLKIHDDPEAIFQQGWLLCDAGEYEAGLRYLTAAVTKGYFASKTLAERSQFQALQGEPAFVALRAQAEAGRLRALTAFRAAGGDRLIGARR